MASQSTFFFDYNAPTTTTATATRTTPYAYSAVDYRDYREGQGAVEFREGAGQVPAWKRALRVSRSVGIIISVQSVIMPFHY